MACFCPVVTVTTLNLDALSTSISKHSMIKVIFTRSGGLVKATSIWPGMRATVAIHYSQSLQMSSHWPWTSSSMTQSPWLRCSRNFSMIPHTLKKRRWLSITISGAWLSKASLQMLAWAVCSGLHRLLQTRKVRPSLQRWKAKSIRSLGRSSILRKFWVYITSRASTTAGPQSNTIATSLIAL